MSRRAEWRRAWRAWVASWWLPVVARELTEQAQRPRTYALRVTFAFLVYVAAMVMFARILSEQVGQSLSVLGRGGKMFDVLNLLELGGIYLFLPALTAGAVTLEKERNTLDLLLLTRLSPLGIILEKLLSRMVLVWSLLLLAAPLATFAYSLGGVTTGELIAAVWILFSHSTLIGALSMKCSTHFPTTTVAIINAYLGACVTIAFPGGCLFPFFFDGPGQERWGLLVLYSLVVWTCSAILIGAAARELTAVHEFGRIDYLTSLRQDLDRYVVNVREFCNSIGYGRRVRSTLPVWRPLAWREMQKSTFGRMRYTLLMVGIIEFWVIYFLLLFVSMADRPDLASAPFLFIVLGLTLLMICTQGANLIASERSKQTLEVLLTTPLSGSDIVVQKSISLWRMLACFALPLATILLYETLWEARYAGGFLSPAFSRWHAVWFIASSAAYLLAAAWASVWAGLAFRSPMKAVLASLALVFGWICVPLLLGRNGLWFPPQWLDYVNPAALILANEARVLEVRPAVVNIALHLALWLGFRALAVFQADRALGRLSVPRPSGEREPLPALAAGSEAT